MLRRLLDRIFGIHGRVKGPDGEEYILVELEIDRYTNKACRYLEKKKYAKAIEYFNKAIECDPGDSTGYWYLGQTYQEMGNKEEARKNYEIALKNIRQRYKELGPEMVDKELIDEMAKDLASLG